MKVSDYMILRSTGGASVEDWHEDFRITSNGVGCTHRYPKSKHIIH